MTDSPFGLSGNDFVCMGMISDSSKEYACLLQIKTGQLYIEEIHWGPGHNINTATLHQVDNDKEWASLYSFVSKSTTIFSPKKVKHVLKMPEFYFYGSAYKKTEEYEKRKKKEIA